jgi:hypothetical protein
MAIHDADGEHSTVRTEQGPIGIALVAAQLAAEQAVASPQPPDNLMETIVSEANTTQVATTTSTTEQPLTLGQLLGQMVDKKEQETNVMAELIHAPARMFQASRMAVQSLFN